MRLLEILARRRPAPVLAVLAPRSSVVVRLPRSEPDPGWSFRVAREGTDLALRCERCGQTVSTVDPGDVLGVLVAITSAHQQAEHPWGGERS